MLKCIVRPTTLLLAALVGVSAVAVAADPPGEEPGRTPQEATRNGLQWLGMLQPLFQGCHLGFQLTQPFVQLEDLMARTAIQRGVATKQEIELWKQQGVAKASVLTKASPDGIPEATCKSIEAEVRNQAPTVSATVQQLQEYLKQHSNG